ncbi:M13-type metalloendopeptidase [Mycolicibacterium parafortuitum]|uniref:M13-type metalloendopeptidase n=1 Tax=Mycolicibacterium parafortuitum TaxID=39692 RepID=UPI0032C428D6
MGALAVALGIGLAVASTGGIGEALADTGGADSASSASDSASASARKPHVARAQDAPSGATKSAAGGEDEPAAGGGNQRAAGSEVDPVGSKVSSRRDADLDIDIDPDADADADVADGDADADVVDSEPDSRVDEAFGARPDDTDSRTTRIRADNPPPAAAPVALDASSRKTSAAQQKSAATETAQVMLAGQLTSAGPLPPVGPPAPPNLLVLLTGWFGNLQRTFFNRAPDARDQTVTLVLDKPENVSDPLALSASDQDGDALSSSLLVNRGPRRGVVTFDQATGTFTYDPDDAFARSGGTDTFTYKVSDASADWHLPGLVSFLTKADFGHADLATVTIRVAPTLRSGIDLTNVDDGVRIQDDPFGWLNGTWWKNYQIPAHRNGAGVIHEVFDTVAQRIRELVTGIDREAAQPDSDAQRIADMFASFMDTAAVADAGVQPLLAELARIDNAADHSALAAVLGSLAGVNFGFETWVDTDAKDSSRLVLQLNQVALGLPDRAYYIEPRHATILAEYPEHIARMFALVYGGVAGDYTQAAQRIVAFESALAAAQWDPVELRDPAAIYNPRSLAELAAEAPGFDWGSWAHGYGASSEHTETVIVRQPDYLTAYAQAWSAESLQDLKVWASWLTIHSRAILLTDDILAENFAFNHQRLFGQERTSDRWQRGLSAVNDVLGFAVGKLYVDKHFPVEAKRQIEDMVDNLLAAYRDSIAELEWMSPETRAKALEKLDKMTVKVGYPETWVDYSGLVIAPDDLYGNYVRGLGAARARDLDRVGPLVDRSTWIDVPQDVNAYYSAGTNEIIFPAGFLLAPLFDPEADIAASYGAIGSVIGHEIGHAFDDEGSQYDGDGNLVDWWTAADRAAFEAKTQRLIEQYDGYVPRQLPNGPHVNGALTVGENIADLGGLAIALKAYVKSLGGQTAPVVDGYTGVQRVLLGYVQFYRGKYNDGTLLSLMATDPHAPAEFRANGVLRNLDAFYEAFGVTETDAMYLPPEQRVRIWY